MTMVATTMSAEEGQDWKDLAACAHEPPELWFPVADWKAKWYREGTNWLRLEYDTAKAVCAGCPAQVECLDYAVRNDVYDGVWGGQDEVQRLVLRQQRRTTTGHRT